MLADDKRAGAAQPGSSWTSGCSPWSAATTAGSRPSRPRAACAARSCCASPVPTCSGWSTPAEVGRALADSAGATVGAALRVAVRKVEVERRGPGAGPHGHHRDGPARRPRAGLRLATPTCSSCTTRCPGVPDDVAAAAAHAVAEELRRLLQLPAPDPPLLVDADLRPEGRQGPLTRSLAAYREYYARWSRVWEAQALLRAAQLAGDHALTDAVPRRCRPRALAGGWPRRDRPPRDPPDQVAGRGRAAAARHRPAAATSSSAPAVWPTSSGRSRCSSCSTPTPCRHCARPARWARSPAAADAGLLESADAGGAHCRLAARDPGSQRADSRTGKARRQPAAGGPGPRRGGHGRSDTLRDTRETSSRTTGGRPAGPGRWWRGCSTHDGQPARRCASPARSPSRGSGSRCTGAVRTSRARVPRCCSCTACPETAIAYRHLFPVLAADRVVIAPDLKGLGASEVRGPYDVADDGPRAGGPGAARGRRSGRRRRPRLGRRARAAPGRARPDLVRRLVVINAPYRKVNLAKAFHIPLFALPVLPEVVFKMGGRRLVDGMLRLAWKSERPLEPEIRDRYAAAYSRSAAGLRDARLLPSERPRTAQATRSAVPAEAASRAHRARPARAVGSSRPGDADGRWPSRCAATSARRPSWSRCRASAISRSRRRPRTRYGSSPGSSTRGTTIDLRCGCPRSTWTDPAAEPAGLGDCRARSVPRSTPG